MSDFELYVPKKPRPKPGSRSMRTMEKPPPHPAQLQFPPFIAADELRPKLEKAARNSKSNHEKLKAAVKKVDSLRIAVRDEAFDVWVQQFLTPAPEPKDWTQSKVLYANYLSRSKGYGQNRGDKRLSQSERATETMFGILLRDAGFPKKRRARGWFYPLMLKIGA